MEIKKSILEMTDNLAVWDNLLDTYLPTLENETFEEMDEVSQTLLLFASMHGQVMNGGIVQFIDNGSGNYFHETLDAARRVNFTELVQILEKAAEQFPNGQIPKDWDERRSLYDELCEKYITYKTFDELNSEEKEIVLKNRIKYGDTTPLDQCSYEEKSSWSNTWEDLDKDYYSLEKTLYQKTKDYLINNAKLID